MNLIPSLPRPGWTMAQLRRHFGMIPAERVLLDPPPGTATEEDVIGMNDHRDRFCELVNGVLLGKTTGTRESLIAGDLLVVIKVYLRSHPLGEALGEGGFRRLFPGVVRIPDVSFIAWERMPGEEFPQDPIAALTPDLAVEVISKGNTKKEMARKLREYFESGTRLVWLVYPKTQTVEVYTTPDRMKRLRRTQTLDGGDVLPGFQLSLAELFAPRRRPKR